VSRRQERALRRLAERRAQEIDKADVDLLCGLTAARLASVTAVPDGVGGLEVVSPAYFARLEALIGKLIHIRDHWST
jgi:hypothetical protein